MELADSNSTSRSFLRKLSFRNIGAVYVLAVIVIVSSIALPETFPTIATLHQILDNNAITALAALTILVPLCAGLYDLSFAYTMSLAGVTSAHFVADTSIGIAPAILIALAVGLCIGVINGIVVVGMKIDSFIGTLATGSLIQALITMVTNDNSITSVKLIGSFSDLGQHQLFGFTLPVYIALVLALVLWRLLEHHRVGRKMYAIGFNQTAARLAGIRPERLRFCALIVSGGLAAVAGVVLASNLSSGSPTSGTAYLLPAFAAVFLGATQLKQGRFNAFGTIIAVILLGTGTTTLGLASAPDWASSMFTGVVLIIALYAAGSEQRSLLFGQRAWSRIFKNRSHEEQLVPSKEPVA
jgi:ribose transport system permease protein